jgi:hypothetical protein
MPNGVAVALALDPAAAPAPAKPTEVEQRIGEAVADAAIMVLAACGDWEAQGRIAGDTRARAGGLFVELYKLQEASGAVDFSAVARIEGKRAIMRRHGAALAEHYGVALDAALDEIISWPLDVLAHITAVERALAH